jgi:hypothetical protein
MSRAVAKPVPAAMQLDDELYVTRHTDKVITLNGRFDV